MIKTVFVYNLVKKSTNVYCVNLKLRAEWAFANSKNPSQIDRLFYEEYENQIIVLSSIVYNNIDVLPSVTCSNLMYL